MRRRVDRGQKDSSVVRNYTLSLGGRRALTRFGNTHKHTRRRGCDESFGSTLADSKWPDIIGGSDRSRQTDRKQRWSLRLWLSFSAPSFIL